MDGVAGDGEHLDAALPVDVVHPHLPQHRQPQRPETNEIGVVNALGLNEVKSSAMKERLLGCVNRSKGRIHATKEPI